MMVAKELLWRGIGKAVLVACAAWLAACGSGDGPDLIFHGGRVLTLGAGDAVAEAVAVRDGRISAVGKASEILGLRTSRTEVRDLKGRTLAPGFIAAREHPTLSSVFGGVVDVSGFTRRSNAEVWDALRQGVAATPKGEWVFAKGIAPILVPDLQMPARASLDGWVLIARSLSCRRPCTRSGPTRKPLPRLA
ncbi:hypothetical protein L6Q96_22505 [Candidatus Binatia bacterium]|nr:hypothetical protein [Candidatus Binatia bacterium]